MPRGEARKRLRHEYPEIVARLELYKRLDPIFHKQVLESRAEWKARHMRYVEDDWKSPEYRAWKRMRKEVKQKIRAADGRRIRICPRWRDDYLAFLEDVGRRPEGEHFLYLIRLDLNKDFKPGNVIWGRGGTRPDYFEFNGHRDTLVGWSKITGLSRSCLRHRLERGLTPEEMFTTPRRYS